MLSMKSSRNGEESSKSEKNFAIMLAEMHNYFFGV
jgi:hypothetical protein